MDSLNEFFTNLSERFNELSQGKKVMALTLVAAAIGSLVVMSFWARTPDMQLLYANLSENDAAAIVDKLKTSQTPYELANQGKTIRVPSDAVYELRLQMASEGLPEGTDVGLEVFDKSALGMTEFIQKLNYQRALQGELARTIRTLDAVEQARVHLVIPKETLFIRDKPKGKASVTLKIKPGQNLSKGQIQGIVHLVSASVEGINAADVVVVDLKGNLLSGDSEATEGAMMTASNYQHKQRVEKEMEKKILNMLEEALGKGKVIARVAATLDFEKVVRTEEIYDPDSQVVRSQQTVTEATLGAVPPGGIPGVQTLVPGGEGGDGAAGQAAKRDKSNLTQNFEINKVVRHVTKPTGEIDSLSVAVLIDGVMAGDPLEYQPRPQEEMSKYLEIVQSAVGYNPDRGDQIKVENIQFDRSLLQDEQQRLEREGQIDLGLQVAKYLLGAIFIILFFTRIVRPLVDWLTTTVEVVPEQQELTDHEMVALDEEKKRIGQLANETARLRETVGEFVAADPKFTAGIIRKWMKEKA
ncbi:MAG: flagellar M-ring protein FliF [Candidatus Nitrohelix vancouverensis]|uniref:Flagellar M-ring protein n=1 Tax=Candidatus Nitrohelix vancouverensis TaxID=2705534 RepID=A0A7T0C277_9BACT|nr:MAG: flagellar M-ring protein FliF [Candidatus Nitrohelix vancouverensis]